MSNDRFPSTTPAEHHAWTALAWHQRVALLLGRRDPDGPAMASAALAQARRLQGRAILLAATGGVAATAVWIALSLLLGDPDGAGWLLSAVLFGGMFFAAYLTLARVQA